MRWERVPLDDQAGLQRLLRGEVGEKAGDAGREVRIVGETLRSPQVIPGLCQSSRPSATWLSGGSLVDDLALSHGPVVDRPRDNPAP